MSKADEMINDGQIKLAEHELYLFVRIENELYPIMFTEKGKESHLNGLSWINPEDVKVIGRPFCEIMDNKI